tara:strand:- start:225 stop:1544 length:1320 start_codon:yes stop_codon:yes gene_type:complete
MAKNSIRDYSATASQNTDINSINIDENCPASNLNNSQRALMAHLKDVSTGAVNLETPAVDQLNFGDNAKAIFGAGNDLQIFHDGSDSFISEVGAGNLQIRADDFYVMKQDGSEVMIRADTDSFVKLFHDGSEKLATTSTGIDVTGAVGGDTLNIDGTVSGDIAIIKTSANSGTGLFINSQTANRIDVVGYDGSAANAVNIRAGGATGSGMLIDTSGKIYFGRTGDPFMSTGSVKRLSIDGGTTSTDSTIVSNKNSASTMFHFYFHNSNSVVGSISTNAHATSFNTSSDHRLKENVADITGAIARVKSLQPKRFNWITEPDTTIDGFLAHEAATVVPESVTGSHNGTRAATGIVKAAGGKVLAENVEQEDWTANKGDDEDDLYPSDSTWTASEDLPVYQTIDQAKLVPVLTAALKEAITKIETLETEMTALKARVTALEA